MHPGSRTCLAALVLVALCAVPSVSHGYGVSGAGGKLGYTAPEDRDGTMMLGGHVELEKTGTRLHLLPNVMYWKVDRLSDLNPNFDVYYHFGREGRVTPYLGGGLGLNLRHSDVTERSNTDLGANLMGGFRFPGRSNHYFLEGRFTASDVSQVAVLGGITFHPPGTQIAGLAR